ncbi:MAG: hypothetical protein HN936_13485 [Bacteroidetes bacterium]|jgi:hypothetical protein|nr:hypothetical protein [Bacteroidota bacterium]MBT7464039.1 hypothetical protein [Bacteroidota bacterium]
MKNNKLLFATLIMIVAFTSTLNAQHKIGFQFFKYAKQEQATGYNFFVGNDAADFQTSVKGFGSGLTDVLTGRSSIDLVNFGTDHISLSIGAGLSISKFRFSQNLVLNLDGETVSWEPDPNPDHDYVNTFFGYGKSKLINSSFYVPLDLNIQLGENWLYSIGGFFDYSFYTKFKSKYKIGDEKVQDVIAPSEMKTYSLNKVKYGVSTMIFNKKLKWGISGSYYLTPFFQEGLGPDIQEVRICFVAGMADIKDEITKDRSNH